MIDIQLTYQLYHQWQTEKNISILGSAFIADKLLQNETLIHYFHNCNSEQIFIERLDKLSGHFAIIIELEDKILASVDLIRTYPIFFRHREQNIVITDRIIAQQDDEYNAIEIENFKKVYNALENNTLLKNWQQLLAGQYLVVDKKNQTVSIKTYYHHAKETANITDTELLNKLSSLEEKLVKNTIEYANNRTILVPLSGGYDSRYILALLKQSNYEKIECFTYGRKNSYEVLIAKNVAEKLNIKWHFIEYTDTLLDTFFSKDWQQYSNANHHFSSLPHEQDFFALHYMKQHQLLPKNAVVINGYCQDIHAGSFIEPIKNFSLQKVINYKYDIQLNTYDYENSWNGYQEWLVKNRLSKFIINSVRVFEYFGIDFYLPFWNRDWIDFCYSLSMEKRLNQKFFNQHLFSGIFKQYHIDFKKPSHDETNSFYTLKKVVKSILPQKITEQIRKQNSVNPQNDVNNSLYLYERIYEKLNQKPIAKDFKINNIHALYFLQNLK